MSGVAKVAEILRLDWQTVNKIMKAPVERGLLQREDAMELLDTLTGEQRLGVKAVAMDMWTFGTLRIRVLFFFGKLDLSTP